jgi:hypothetical protein
MKHMTENELEEMIEHYESEQMAKDEAMAEQFDQALACEEQEIAEMIAHYEGEQMAKDEAMAEQFDQAM